MRSHSGQGTQQKSHSPLLLLLQNFVRCLYGISGSASGSQSRRDACVKGLNLSVTLTSPTLWFAHLVTCSPGYRTNADQAYTSSTTQYLL